jgi:glycosyl transferase family 25
MSQRIQCFAINVAKNTYRRDHILSLAGTIGYTVNIFDAVTPQTMDINLYDDKRTRRFTGRSLLGGEIACAQSHMALWGRLMDDKDHDHYLILEDDISVTHSMKMILDQLNLTQIDFLKLSGQIKRPMKDVQSLQSDMKLVQYAYGPLDAAAYLVSKKGAKELLDYCTPIYTPVDIMMDRSYDHGITVFGVMPYAANTAFDFDKDSPLFTDVGIRDYKYDGNTTFLEKISTKAHRIIGSVKRKIATIRLHRSNHG